MGSLNSGLLNVDKDTVKDTLEVKNVSGIKSISNNPYNSYNELDKYKYNVKEYWKNFIASIDKKCKDYNENTFI